jgi:steroid delta-isomerase-like uncharacterized protein
MRTTFVWVAALGTLVAACDYASDRPMEEGISHSAQPASVPVASSVAAAPSAAPAPKPKPKPEEVIPKTLQAAVDAWNAHDATKVAANYAPTAKLVIPGFPDTVGRDAIAAGTKPTFTAFPDFKVAVTRVFIKGNVAAFEWVFTGKNDGPTATQKATGRQVGIAGASVVTFDDDGLMKEEHRYFDAPTQQSQLDPKAKAGTFRAPLTLPTGALEVHVAKGTPDEAKTVDQGNAILKAYSSHDEKAYLATATDDYVWEDYTSPAAIKKADLKADIANYTKTFPDWQLPQTMAMGVDGYFVTEIAMAGTQKGPLGTIKASNKPVNMRLLDIQLLKDGKASKEWSYGNTAELLSQIGALPPVGAAPAASGSAAPTTSAAPAAPTASAKAP